MSAAREHRLAAGCVAGMAIAAGGSWLRIAVEHTARIDTHTWPFVVASAVAGAGILLTGACSLRLAPTAHRLSWRALWGWAVAVQLVAWGAAALTSSDVFANLAYGTLSLRGLSPYTHFPSALTDSPLRSLAPATFLDDPAVYGPVFVPVARAAAWAGTAVGAPLWGGVAAWKAIVLASVLAALALAARHLRRARPGDAAEIFTTLALGPLVAWELPGQGHTDGLVLLSLVALLTASAAGRDRLAAAAGALGACVKYSAAPLLALHLVALARRSPRRAAAAAAVAGVTAALVFWPEARHLTLRSYLPLMGVGGSRHAHSLADLACLVLDALRLPAASLAVHRLLTVAGALVCGGVLLRGLARVRTPEDVARAYLQVAIAIYLTTPWFQPWYVSWALPTLLLERDARWRRLVAVFAVVTVAQWIVQLDPVTTVVGNAWLVTRLWRLRQAAAPAPVGALPAA